MFKQFFLAMLATATLFTISCKKDETCAKCELRDYCATCTIVNGAITTECHYYEPYRDDFVNYCQSAGGTISGLTNALVDKRELCNEDGLVVNAFMDEKVAEDFKCEYVD